LIFFRLSLGFSYEFEGDLTHARAIIEIEQNHLLPSSQRGFALSMGIAMDGPKSRPGGAKNRCRRPTIVMVVTAIRGNQPLDEFF